ncbi:hypothetical protein ACFQU7_01085 [Pseudoroseomonas wenyumeiae]
MRGPDCNPLPCRLVLSFRAARATPRAATEEGEGHDARAYAAGSAGEPAEARGPTQDPKKSNIKAETLDRDPKQGRSGDIKQNTTHQGYQQDR